MVNVRLVFIGKNPPELDVRNVTSWKSDLFKIYPEVRYPLNLTPDIYPWGYSDVYLSKNLPSVAKVTQQTKDNQKTDLTFYIIDAPLENNWLSRIIEPNRIVVTFYEAKDILKKEYIPFENYIIQNLYFYSLLFVKAGTGIITMDDELNMVHGARRCCVFDMCGLKEEMVDSCIEPILCTSCKKQLENVDENLLMKVEQELKGLKRSSYYKMALFLKAHPWWSLIASLVAAIVCGVLGSFIYQGLIGQ